jgi:hypothetical protein
MALFQTANAAHDLFWRETRQWGISATRSEISEKKLIQSVRATLCGRPLQNPADFSWLRSELLLWEMCNLFG